MDAIRRWRGRPVGAPSIVTETDPRPRQRAADGDAMTSRTRCGEMPGDARFAVALTHASYYTHDYTMYVYPYRSRPVKQKEITICLFYFFLCFWREVEVPGGPRTRLPRPVRATVVDRRGPSPYPRPNELP